MLPLTVASTRADPAAGPAPPTLGRHGDVRRDWTGNTDGRRPTGAARFHALCADLRAGSVAVAGRSRLRRDVGESGSRRQLDKDRVADAVDRALSCPPASVTVAVDDRDRGRSFTTREIGGPNGRRVGDWSGELPPRQPPLIEPDLRFSLIRLSDDVHVTAVAVGCHRIDPASECTPSPLNQA